MSDLAEAIRVAQKAVDAANRALASVERRVLEGERIEDFDALTWAAREHLEMWAEVVDARTGDAAHVRVVVTWLDQLRRQLGFADNGFTKGRAVRLVPEWEGVGDGE